jgi:hypothetical protein
MRTASTWVDHLFKEAELACPVSQRGRQALPGRRVRQPFEVIACYGGAPYRWAV